MKVKEAVTFEIAARDGRVMRWDGEGFADATPTKTKSHEPVITVRRAPDRVDGKVSATVLRGWVGMPAKAKIGDEVALEPGLFEQLRRDHCVARVRPLLRPCRVCRPWRTGLPEVVYLTDKEIGRRLEAREVEPVSQRPAVLDDPNVMADVVPFVSFVSGYVDAQYSDGWRGMYTRAAEPIFVRAGQIVTMPRARAKQLEAMDKGALLEPGDRAFLDGVEIEVPAGSAVA